MTETRLGAPSGLVIALVAAGSVLGLMGTDLVLPAVPSLPEAVGGDATRAQFVLAAYVAGTAIGLIAYGALADRHETRTLLIGSLLTTAAASLACALADRIEALIALRALQGAVAAGPAVLAPAIIKALLDDKHAIRAIGALGSAEALAPAIAPIAGAWLLGAGGWRLSFAVIAGLAVLLAAAVWHLGALPRTARRIQGRYGFLIRDPVFLHYALSHAFTLGGLLTFVFGMPAVLVRALGGTLADFVLMQVCGIACFLVAANLTGHAAARLGPDRLIGIGTALAAAGALAILAYALAGGRHPLAVTALFVLVNTGLGLRGPPGFYRAVVAARNDDARGAALVILCILAAAAAGTACAAPFIEQGLVPLAAIAFALHGMAMLCLAALPRLDDGSRNV